MGLFEALFGKRKTADPAATRFETLTAYQPAFRSWGGQIYESELVRAAVDAKARHAAKLQYSMEGTARMKLWTNTKAAPNPWMTWSQFMERCSNIYEIQNNLFIVPILDEYGEVTGFFPVLPSECEVVDMGGDAWLKFTFNGGKKKSLPLSRIGVVVKHQLTDDFFGEKNNALNGTMELVNMVNQGIEQGVKNSATFRFMAQLTSKSFDEDLRERAGAVRQEQLPAGIRRSAAVRESVCEHPADQAGRVQGRQRPDEADPAERHELLRGQRERAAEQGERR